MARRVETLLTLALALALALASAPALALEDSAFWLRAGQAQLVRALRVQPNVEQARNVIVFIGDGMGVNTVTATRILQGQRHGKSGEEHELSFDKFPFVGLAKTYNVDKQVPDSAGTATAILTGVKVQYGTIGLDASATPKRCDAGDALRRLPGVATWAQQAGKATGVVTTTRITHATPAAAYAHVNHRFWECDSEVPVDQRQCVKDVARQLVEDSPGDKLNVILGGGWKQMGVVNVEDGEPDSCVRSDGRNLADQWLKAKKGKRAMYVDDLETLMSADVSKVDHLLGLFSPGHLPYVSERSPQQPSLANMTLQAIKLLKRNANGYFLLVEAGRIDHGHHDNLARLALGEACELDETVAAVLAVVDVRDTLVVVTADHSHAMTMNGYPKRGADILGVVNRENETSYETLTYANGPGYSTHRVNGSALSGTDDTWVPVETMDRSHPRYMHLSAMYRKTETHAGEDVAVYSTGPFAHLLTGVFEQNYIGHVIAYAACIGPSEELCRSTNMLTSNLPQCEPHPSVANRGTWHGIVDFSVCLICLVTSWCCSSVL